VKVHIQEEVAAMLGKSVATIYRLRLAGALAFIPGRPVTITDAALQAYLEKQRAAEAGGEVRKHAVDRAAFVHGRRLARRVAASDRRR
jgi:hypothetical protein